MNEPKTSPPTPRCPADIPSGRRVRLCTGRSPADPRSRLGLRRPDHYECRQRIVSCGGDAVARVLRIWQLDRHSAPLQRRWFRRVDCRRRGRSRELSTPLVNELNTLCARVESEGNSYLRQGIAESSSLSLINPIVDPLLAALANGLKTVGTQYGPSLAPFGPTVAGLGGTVAFFEGS